MYNGVASPFELDLIGRKTIQETGASGAPQISLAAAARTVGRSPRGIAATVAVMVADLRAARAIGGTGPVAAGMLSLFPWKIRSAVIL